MEVLVEGSSAAALEGLEVRAVLYRFDSDGQAERLGAGSHSTAQEQAHARSSLFALHRNLQQSCSSLRTVRRNNSIGSVSRVKQGACLTLASVPVLCR